MNLYHVQDADRPMWVAAESLADAISRWEAHGRDEYGDADEVEPPQGVQLICEDYEFLPASPDSAEIEELQRTIDKLTRERDQLAMLQPRIDEARKHAERLIEGSNIAVPLVHGNYQMGYVAGCNDAGIGLKGLLEVNQSKLSDVKDNLLWLYSSPSDKGIDQKVWTCKIGSIPGVHLPAGSDEIMRKAVQDAYTHLMGVKSDFIFSGWGGKLTEGELAVVENREPVCGTCANSRVIDKCGWTGEHSTRYQEPCPDCMLADPEPDTMCGSDGRKYCTSKATLKATEELLAARNDKLEAVESLLGKFVGNHDDDGYSLQWWCEDRSLILTRDAEGKWTYLQSWEDGDEVGTCDGDMDGFSVIFGLLLWLHGENTIPKVEK